MEPRARNSTIIATRKRYELINIPEKIPKANATSIVEFLALGSVSLLNKKRLTESYLIFNIAADIFLLFSLATNNVGDIITHGVVFGPLPILVTIASSMVTFPAAVLLVVISAVSYRKPQ